MRKIEYCPISMKTLLTKMKDTSELMLDLGYSAVIYGDRSMAMEVLRLEEKMDTYDYHVGITAMLAARNVEDAESLSGILQIASAAEIISNAAGDIAKIVLFTSGIPAELKKDLRQAEETVARVEVGKGSPVIGKSLDDLNFETEAAMKVIAIRRGESWIYDPEVEIVLQPGDILFARGHDEGQPLLMEMVTGKPYDENRVQEISGVETDLTRAVDIIVEMKNRSELAVGLAYIAVLFYNLDVAGAVVELEGQLDAMRAELQRWVLESAKHVQDVDILRGLLILSVSAEIISDAALKISNVVRRDVEPHPILAQAIRESDEVITHVEIHPGAPMDGKSLRELELETETGMYVLAIRSDNKWTYNPKSRTVLKAGDLLFARGCKDGEELLQELSGARPKP